MKKLSVVLIVIIQFVLVWQVTGQETKKLIEQSTYYEWKNVGSQQFSEDGEWISFEINPQRNGDGWLYLKRIGAGSADSVARGTDASFSPNSNFLAFKVVPQWNVVRQARVDGKSQAEMPKDSLFIWNFSDMSLTKIERVKSFSTASDESDWMVYHKEPEPGRERDRNSSGTTLVAYNPVTGDEHSFENVDNYNFSSNGRLLGFIQTGNNSDDHTSVSLFNTESGTTQTIVEGEGSAARLTFDNEGRQAGLLFTKDTEDPKIYSLYYWKDGDSAAEEVADPSVTGMPEGWSASVNGSLSFSENGSRLFFGTAPKPEPEPEDTLLPNERYHVEVWHWEDPLIQSQQNVQKQRELRRTYDAVFHINDRRMAQLAREDMPELRTIQGGEGDIALGSSHLPYRRMTTWTSSNYRDYYLVDVTTGDREMVLEKDLFHTSLSPDGEYLLYYNYTDRSWYSMSVDDRTVRNLTGEIPHEFYNILDDRPQEPSPYGIAGWVEGNRYVLIYDHHDIWQVDPAGSQEPVNLTGGYGRENNMRLRYVDLEGNDYIGRRQRMMLDAFNNTNKQSGFYEIQAHRPGRPSRLVMEDVNFYRPSKAENADIMVWRKSTFRMYPDLWVSDLSFGNARKISDANPQQDQYRWGDVQLVEWVSFNNDTLQGLLYTPEDFDPNKKYPMIINFYELRSHRKHNYFNPAPSNSRINFTNYVNHGYVAFVPDIVYIEGYPGHSAYNSIVSGTKAMINQFDFIDRENIALSDRSWGGYQGAYLATQTDMFKAIVAGCIVSNMFSAYGGIRWASGRSRQFQYEDTQSRIGGSIWEYPLRFLENSPLFFADKINTPILMMHNDADGAVPFEQGIEMYMAMRRLNKPVWMLNYVGDAHSIQRWPNRLDYDIRLMQFFDHFLKGKPAPVWMEEGIPAVKRERMDGYDLVE